MKENSTLKRKSSEHHQLHHKAHFQHEQTHQKQQTSSFVKQKIGQIIKTQLKTFTLRSNLIHDLESHHKQAQNKLLAKNILETKIQNYHEAQKNIRNKKYQQFLKKQKYRQEKLKRFITDKKQQHQVKFATINQSIQITKSRYNQMSAQDSNLRLSKLAIYTSQGRRKNSMGYNSSRSVSVSQSHRQVIKEEIADKENHLVTNYLNKIKKSESRVLEKQLQNQQRKQLIKKMKVRCLIDQRNKQETQLMQRVQKDYQNRMNHFQINSAKTHSAKESMQMSRSVLHQKHCKIIAQRRQNMHKQSIQNVPLALFQKSGLLREFKETVDLTNNLRNMHLNLKKKKDEQTESQLEAQMKILTEKLKKIKNLKYGEKLDPSTIRIVLSMLDRNDSQYNNIADFLQSERKAYLESYLKREQEKNKFDRMKKLNKAMSKAIVS